MDAAEEPEAWEKDAEEPGEGAVTEEPMHRVTCATGCPDRETLGGGVWPLTCACLLPAPDSIGALPPESIGVGGGGVNTRAPENFVRSFVDALRTAVSTRPRVGVSCLTWAGVGVSARTLESGVGVRALTWALGPTAVGGVEGATTDDSPGLSSVRACITLLETVDEAEGGDCVIQVDT